MEKNLKTTKTKNISTMIMLTLLILIGIFTLSIVVYGVTKTKPKQNTVYIDTRTNAYFMGMEYAIDYLNHNKYMKNVQMNIDIKNFLDNMNSYKDSLSFDQYYYYGFNYTFGYMHKKGYLIDEDLKINIDSLIYNCEKDRNIFEKEHNTTKNE